MSIDLNELEKENNFIKYYGQDNYRSEEIIREQIRSPRVFSITKSIPLLSVEDRIATQSL